jgi:hypothetical protein
MARDPYKPQVVVKNGRPTSVIIAIGDYEALLEAAEQAADLKAIRAMKKGDWQTVSFEDYLRKTRRRVSA